MNQYELTYVDYDSIKRALEFSDTKNVFLSFCREAGLKPHTNDTEAGQFQLYFRLQKTGLHIQQCIFIHGTSIACRTTIAELSDLDPHQVESLYPIISRLNEEIEFGSFRMDVQESVSLQYWDWFCPDVQFEDDTMLYYFESIDRLLDYPHFLIDREYVFAYQANQGIKICITAACTKAIL